MATSVARRPTTRPLASITTHFFCTSAGLAEKVFMCGFRENGNRRPRGAELKRVSSGVAQSRQRFLVDLNTAKTIAYKYGVILPQKTLCGWNGIGRRHMRDRIGRFP